MTEFVNTLGISLKDIGRAIGLEVIVRNGVLLTNALPTVAQLQQGLYASREHDALCCCNMGGQQELWRQGLSDSWQQGMGGSLPSYRQQEMWRKSLSINSSFCKALVSTGYLTWQQMLDAVCRYRLGADRKGRVIFWQIDRDERICDGKVMAYGPDCHRLKEKEHAPTWVSALLAKRHGGRQEGDIVRHCLFGLHLLHPRNAWMTGQMPPNFPSLATAQADDSKPLGEEGSVLQPGQALERKMGESELPKAITSQPDGNKSLGQDGSVLQPAQAHESKMGEDELPKAITAQADGSKSLGHGGSVLQPGQTLGSRMGGDELPKAGTAQTDDSKPHWQEGTVLQPWQTQGSRKGGDELPPVAVVEAEKTAVILSAYYPQYVWLATGGLFEVQPEKFRPLKGRKVILFPDADPDGKAYAYWFEAAQQVMAQPYWDDSPPIRVSALLEQHATPEQKSRKIDLVEFITESKEKYHYHGKF